MSDDFLYWPLHKSGTFSVKSGYYATHVHSDTDLLLGSFNGLSFLFLTQMWELDLLPRCKVFLWKLCTNSLALCKNLVSRGIPVSPLCPLCQNEEETLQHLFRRCHVTKRFWLVGDLGICSDANPDVCFPV